MDRVLGCKGSMDKFGVLIFSIVSCQLLHVKLSVGNQVKRLPKSVRWFIICLKSHRLVQVFFLFYYFFWLNVVLKSSLCLFGKYGIVCRRASLEYVNHTKC